MIFLDFARAKAIYEQFVSIFGKIPFPIVSGDTYNDVDLAKHINL